MNEHGLIIYQFDLTHHVFTPITLKTLDLNNQDKNIIYWIHCDPSEKKYLALLTEKLHLPEDVLQLCKGSDQLSKLIDRDETVTLKVQTLDIEKVESNLDVELNNIVIHLTHKYCFTAGDNSLTLLTTLQNSFEKSIRHSQTPCFLLFLLLDYIVNDYAEALFDFEIEAEEIDIHLKEFGEDAYKNIVELKRKILQIKRYALSVREILMRLSGRKISVVSEQCRQSLYNLSNHNHTVVHEADSIREMLNSILGQIDNALMQRLNETMRVLTAFAAIFLPLTLITGIYGMNFQWIPELSWKYGYFFALGLILTCAIGLIYFFKHKKWF